MQPNATVASAEAQVVSKAVLRAAEQLGVANSVLARTIGVSEATVSRMRNQGLVLAPADKAFELAVLFVRLYRSLDAVTGGDSTVARAWLANMNTALDGRPIDRIQTITGLTHVIGYLDSRRALV
ncbi:antitoxin Xre/MbcA/ParS toxin-binding domain-containing protein [Azospirillum sp. sgz302134]